MDWLYDNGDLVQLGINISGLEDIGTVLVRNISKVRSFYAIRVSKEFTGKKELKEFVITQPQAIYSTVENDPSYVAAGGSPTRTIMTKPAGQFLAFTTLVNNVAPPVIYRKGFDFGASTGSIKESTVVIPIETPLESLLSKAGSAISGAASDALGGLHDTVFSEAVSKVTDKAIWVIDEFEEGVTKTEDVKANAMIDYSKGKIYNDTISITRPQVNFSVRLGMKRRNPLVNYLLNHLEEDLLGQGRIESPRVLAGNDIIKKINTYNAEINEPVEDLGYQLVTPSMTKEISYIKKNMRFKPGDLQWEGSNYALDISDQKRYIKGLRKEGEAAKGSSYVPQYWMFLYREREDTLWSYLNARYWKKCIALSSYNLRQRQNTDVMELTLNFISSNIDKMYYRLPTQGAEIKEGSSGASKKSSKPNKLQIDQNKKDFANNINKGDNNIKFSTDGH